MSLMPNEIILMSKSLEASAAEVVAAVKAHGLEGVIATMGRCYQLSYGETTKRAAEASVFNASTLPQGPHGAGSINDPNWPGAKFPAGGFENQSPMAGDTPSNHHPASPGVKHAA